jgi:AcrR family transcriptional regulator
MPPKAKTVAKAAGKTPVKRAAKAAAASPGPARRGRPSNAAREARDSREHILQVATRLFAARGLHVPSIRDVTEAAGVNVALVKYYFGSKQGLLEAVIRSVTGPVIAERHRLLDECVVKPGTGAEYVHRVVAAYVQPVLSLADHGADGAAHRRLIGLAWSDPERETRALMDAIFDGAARRLVTILRSACPHLTDEEVRWRAACIFSVIYTLYTDPGRVRNMVGADLDVKDREGLLKYVVPFLVAGMTHR